MIVNFKSTQDSNGDRMPNMTIQITSVMDALIMAQAMRTTQYGPFVELGNEIIISTLLHCGQQQFDLARMKAGLDVEIPSGEQLLDDHLVLNYRTVGQSQEGANA